MGVAGAWRLLFPLQICRLRLTSAAGNALFALSSRLCGPAPSGKADGEMERSCSPILFSSLRASFSPSDIIRQERYGEADGKPLVRLPTGDPVSSPEAAFSEMPLCPGGCSREARWLRYRAGDRGAVSCLPHFSSSTSPHSPPPPEDPGRGQWIRRADGHFQEGAGAAA